MSEQSRQCAGHETHTGSRLVEILNRFLIYTILGTDPTSTMFPNSLSSSNRSRTQTSSWTGFNTVSIMDLFPILF